jgi:hypothetical protein
VYFEVVDFSRSPARAREKALDEPGAVVFPRPFFKEPEIGKTHRFPIGQGPEFKELDRTAEHARQWNRPNALDQESHQLTERPKPDEPSNQVVPLDDSKQRRGPKITR